MINNLLKQGLKESKRKGESESKVTAMHLENKVHIYPHVKQGALRAKDLCTNQAKVFVSFNEVSLCYKKELVMQDINLEVFKGEVLTLIGPSGSGKTTLLKALAGLEPVCKGVIAIGNKIASQPGKVLDASKRKVAMVFQDHALFPHMTVMENIMFPLKNGSNKIKITAEKKCQIEEILEELELQEYVNTNPHQLSGGQRQRASLARALVASPELLLLDEPFASQDPELKVQLQLTVQRLIWRLGITTIMVTHNQAEALSMGDRVGVMCNGKLLQINKPQDVYRYPKTRFVANFIGYGSFLPAEITKNCLKCEFGRFSKFRWAATRNNAGKNAHLFLRPDNVVISSAGNLRAVVEKQVFLGANNLFELLLPSGSKIMALMPSRYSFKQGQAVSVSVDLANALVFPVE